MTTTEIHQALRLAWRALLADIDNATDHNSMLRATSAATTSNPGEDSSNRSASWYAAAICHYLDAEPVAVSPAMTDDDDQPVTVAAGSPSGYALPWSQTRPELSGYQRMVLADLRERCTLAGMMADYDGEGTGWVKLGHLGAAAAVRQLVAAGYVEERPERIAGTASDVIWVRPIAF